MIRLLRMLSGVSAGGRAAANVSASTQAASGADQQMALGLAHHQAGRLEEAEVCYRETLTLHPDHYDALHLLGVTMQQRGDATAALEWVERAIAITPTNAKAYVTLGICYQCLNRLQLAETALRTAMRLDPCSDASYNGLGVVLLQMGNVIDARTSFETALRLNPANVEASNNLGNVWLDAGDLDRAEPCYREVLERQPGFSQARMNLGVLLKRRGQLDAAAACYRIVVDATPGNAQALTDLGAILLASGRLSEAVDCLRRAVQINPGLTAAFCRLAECMFALHEYDQAELACRQALELHPGSADALNLLALLLIRLDLARAETCCRAAIAADPARDATHNTLGTILRARGNLAGAEACFRDALRLNPEAAISKYNLATCLLQKGDYENGFELYENRFTVFRERMAHARKFARDLGGARRWSGQRLAGARMLVWTEQGFGDSLMMLRYLTLLKQHRARQVIVVCQPELRRLVGLMPTVDRVVSTGDDLSPDDFDLHCPIMSLPHELKTRSDSVPHDVPYLAVSRQLADAWRNRLGDSGKLKVGLAWAGSETLDADSRRSIPLSSFAPLFDVPRIQVISLQKTRKASDEVGAGLPIVDRMAECDDFLDTAALLQSLDLVVSVDTAVAHLAGALGKTIWLLNRLESEWRWGSASNRSIWYPTMAVFNQREPDQWESVIQDVAAELRRMVGASRSER